MNAHPGPGTEPEARETILFPVYIRFYNHTEDIIRHSARIRTYSLPPPSPRHHHHRRPFVQIKYLCSTSRISEVNGCKGATLTFLSTPTHHPLLVAAYYNTSLNYCAIQPTNNQPARKWMRMWTATYSLVEGGRISSVLGHQPASQPATVSECLCTVCMLACLGTQFSRWSTKWKLIPFSLNRVAAAHVDILIWDCGKHKLAACRSTRIQQRERER